MPDEALQTAFEIKTTCDEISRKLLRWHWEQKYIHTELYPTKQRKKSVRH